MKKLLSLLLAIAMVISMVPSVFASTDGEGTTDTSINGSVDAGYWFDEVLVDGASVSVEADDDDGYTYKWTAEEVGNLSIYMYADEGCSGDAYIYYGDETIILSETEEGAASFDVNAGDVVYIQVFNTGDVTFTAYVYPAFEPPMGTQGNPETIADVSEVIVTIEEGNEIGYYLAYYNKMASGTLSFVATCDNADAEYNVVLTKDGDENVYEINEDGFVSVEIGPWEAVYFHVTASAAAEITMTGELVAPVGTQANPEVVWDLSEINVSIAEGNSQGYYYSYYNRGATGTISLSVSSATEGVEYDVILTNTVSGDMAWLCDSEDGTVEIAIVPNDTVIIQVVTAPDSSWNYPAAEIVLNGEYIAPVGDMNNPAQLVIGENTASIAAGNFQGYTFNWTAEADGTLSITMPEGGWSYVINNVTAGTYGDIQRSDSDPVVNPGTVEVAAGDVIQIVVNTYDPADQWNNPAGDLVILAAFEEASSGPVITTQPVDSNSIENAYAEFYVGVENTEGVSYQWYVSTDNGATWSEATFKSAKSATLSVQAAPRHIGKQFYCVVTDANGKTATSEIATLTLKAVNFTISGLTKGPKEAVMNRTAVIRFNEITSETVTYNWYMSKDGGNTWESIHFMKGGTTYRLEVVLFSDRVNALFRCKVTDAEGAYIYTTPVELVEEANPMSVVTNAESVEAVVNTSAVFHFEVTGYDTSVNYKWYYCKDGENWYPTSASGYNTSTLTINAFQYRDGYKYRCVATDKVGHKLTSNEVTLTIAENPLKIAVDAQSTTVAVGETATFHFEVADNVGDVTYQWYFRKPGGSWGKTSATGATSDTLQIEATAARNGYQYYCVVYDSVMNRIESARVTLNVE